MSDKCWGWSDNRSIQVTKKTIPIKKSCNLTAPHQKFVGGEFRDIRHVDIDEGWCSDTVIVSLDVAGEIDMIGEF